MQKVILVKLKMKVYQSLSYLQKFNFEKKP